MFHVEPGRLSPNPWQPREGTSDRDVSELAESIRRSGVLQPILVRPRGDGFEIVAGERRWRAAQVAGLGKVPVVVRQITDEETATFALVENLQREDLNPMEKARAFRSLQEQLKVTQDQLAERVGLDRSTVTNFVRLLDLTADVQAHVSRGTVSMGHARALLAVRDPAAQVALCEEVIRRGHSVRMLEARVKAIAETGARSPAPAARKAKQAAWLKEIEECLTETLSAPTTVRYGRNASVIQITCAGREEFERIYARLKDC
jgi:ParB family chromosome partitioning protein